MFDFVAKHKRLLQIILGLMIVPPFAFWGIQWTQRDVVGPDTVAKVGGQRITDQEFTEALRQQQDRMRQLLGRNYNPALMESPAMRSELLDGMISQRVLTEYAVRGNVAVSTEQLRDAITSIPAFQEDGKFSSARYETLLRGEGYSPATFEASVRRDLMLQQLTGALSDSGIASKAVAQRLARLSQQQREVAESVIAADPKAREAQPSAEAVRAYYDQNPAQFQVPEQISVEYVVLDADALAAAEQIDPNAVRSYYEQNAAKYGQPEQRQASHILLSYKPNATDADKAKVRAKAEQVLAEVRKSPGSFAALAKKYSQDPGSAPKGGDLGWFARGMMVPQFEDAAFRMKPNGISGLVESEFGLHIIKLTGVKPGKKRPLEEVRPEIERELKRQAAQRRYPEAAESFSNTVYEQPDSLKPAADKFHLQVRRADGVTRQSAPVQVLSQPRVLQALFSEDVITNKRNSEAVEAAPNTLVAARMVEHKAASQRPFEAVKADIERLLAQRQAREIAAKRGAERLAQLKKGDVKGVAFAPAKTVSREKAAGLAPAAVSRVFSVDASALPAYVGVEVPAGYALYRVSKVIDTEPDEARQRAVQSELGRANGEEEFRSFLTGLRADVGVEINRELLDKKPQ
ncbi:MAG TPA: SurA N-terminal domain-containing protein [Burkholderiales bacterium]|nr:SurA N-terminal domain-containing protein [Burkholderiales bacterium]